MKKTITYILGFILLAAAPAGAQEYTLDQFLARVEQNSKELKLARQEIKYAGAEKREALSYALPNLSAGADYTHYLSDAYMYMDMSALGGEENLVKKIRTNRSNIYGANITLSQTLFNGSVLNAIKAAGQYEKLTDFIYDATYQEILTAARQAFYQAILLKEVWEVSRNSEQNAYDNFVNVKNSFENGLVSEFQLLQAEVRHKETVPQTAEARRNYEIALINLKNLAGIGQEQPLNLAGNLDTFPDLPSSVSTETVFGARPDFQALRWEEKLRQTGVRAEQSGYLPSLAGFVSYNYSSQSDEWKLEEENNVWLVGLKLSVPIFEGGGRQAKVRKTRINLEKTRLDIQRARDNIDMELRSLRLRLEEAYDRIESARAARMTAEKAFTIAEATARSGLTTQLELKDSRVVLDQAMVGYYSAVFEYLATCFAWEKAVGAISDNMER